MNTDLSVINSSERAVFGLRSIYEQYGYTQYKMNRFEEYELYVRNKDFLVSDNIITFTDKSGKLMALKPDVTLSIIKNTDVEIGCVRKVYYDENVYRIPRGAQSFREIMMVGLECIGDIDSYNIFEVLMLAAESLKSISDDCVLDISHMGIVSGLIDSLDLSAVGRREVLKCIGEKNAHGALAVCREENADPGRTELLCSLIKLDGRPDSVLPELRRLFKDEFGSELSLLETVTAGLKSVGLSEVIRIDFSVVNAMNYYNGIVFRGFVAELPTGVLSGGQYDKLMARMGHSEGAIGFAVYLDMLEDIFAPAKTYDVDAVVLYDESADPSALNAAVRELSRELGSVTAQKAVPKKLLYRRLYRFNSNKVELLHDNT